MTKKIFGLGEMLKSMGIEIKGFEKVFQDAERIVGKFKLKNGTLADYECLKFPGDRFQTLSIGGKTIHYNTRIKPSNTIIYSDAKKAFVSIPNRKISTYVVENGKVPFAAKYDVTPVGVHYNRTPNGAVGTQVDLVQKFHSNRRMGDFVMPNDMHVGANGQQLRIYQRSPWVLSNNREMLSL